VLVEQHIALVLVSTGVAVAIGRSGRHPRVAASAPRPRAILALANIAQTVPSLALLDSCFRLPFIGGIGPRTALVALSIYALLPIMRTTLTGIQSVDRSVVEAGVAMGMTDRQVLWMVELPWRCPQSWPEVRHRDGDRRWHRHNRRQPLAQEDWESTSSVGFRWSIRQRFSRAPFRRRRWALTFDTMLAWLERRVPVEARRRRDLATAARRGRAAPGHHCRRGLRALRSSSGHRGSKNFTEQVILGELVAQTIEAEGGVEVVRKLNLGGTFVCDRGLRSGDLDV